jgi:membrane protease YdiL (CAAX protease family)
MIFALLHGSATAFLPLFALGVFFALAYERTGRIAVPMIAHALFNLHTILLVMAGVTTD